MQRKVVVNEVAKSGAKSVSLAECKIQGPVAEARVKQ